jgi:chromosome segregation ATPase
MSEAENNGHELSPVEVAERDVERSEAIMRVLMSELAHVPAALAEATAAMDTERLRSLRWRREELEGEIVVNKLLLHRRRLNLLDLERTQLAEAQHELLEQMGEKSRQWQETTDLANELLADHNNMVIERTILESRVEANRQQQREIRREIEALIEKQQEVTI